MAITETLRNPLSMFDVKGKVAVITGASGAFGRACALSLGALGGKLVLASGNLEELDAVLAEVIEESVKIDMCKQVGCKPGASPKVLGLAALRMMHDICATGFEKGAQAILPKYGYDIDGFTHSLKQPVVSQAIDQCLTEIAAESPEILQYFESPYSRLALSWSGALLSCIKKKGRYINHNASELAARDLERRHAVRHRMRRSTSDGQEHGNQPPVVPNVVTV